MNATDRIALAKSSIVALIAAGTIPATVATFSELHDYIDANELGSLCDESTWPEVDGESAAAHADRIAECGRVQSAVDAWLRDGRAS